MLEENKPMIDTSHELKWKRTLRKRLIKCLSLIEDHGKPTQDLMFQLRLAKEALTYWNSDSAAWEKHSMIFPLKPQSDIQSSEVKPINLD
jgi:hypothetical protein